MKKNNVKVIVINGSPRKTYNTAALAKAFAKGAKSVTENVEYIDLYDLKFTGCRECYACKLANSPARTCAVRDDAKELLERMETADVIAFGSPIFFSEIAGQLRCLLERWMFPNIQFLKNDRWAIPEKHIRTAFLITQNVSKIAGEMGGLSTASRSGKYGIY